MMAGQVTPETAAERVEAHDSAALQAVRVACRDHQAHATKIDDGERGGGGQAQRDLAARDRNRALGAAAALEELADVLGVALTEDRRRHPANAAALTDRAADHTWAVATVTPLGWSRRAVGPIRDATTARRHTCSPASPPRPSRRG